MGSGKVASKTLVLLEDDLEGGEAAETLRFAFDGKAYAIDLNEKNAAKLRKAIAPYVEAARREGSVARGKSRTHVATDVDPAAVRAWASSHGYSVSARGRVSREITDAFRAAGN
jgi:Lsr2